MRKRAAPKQTLKFYQERVNHLEELNRFTLDALEMAASVGDFQPNITRLEDISVILRETKARILRLIQFQAVAFFMVEPDSNDFTLACVEPEEFRSYVQEQVDHLIENGTFSWSLMEKRPVILTSKNQQKQIILHVMATSSRIRGMFVGVMEKDKMDIPDISLYLLSIVLLNSSNAIETFQLYNMIREINKDLENEKEKYKYLFEAAPDGVEVLSSDGAVIDCNETQRVMTGYLHEEIVGRKAEDFFSPTSKALFKTDPAGGRGDCFEREVELVCKDGSVLPVWRKEKVILDGNRNFKGSVVYNHDLSAIRRTQQEKLNLEAQLRQAQKMEAIGTLAGGIAHDFNNILGAILGYTEMVLYKLSQEDPLRPDLLQVFQAGHRAKELVRQILTFSRQSEQNRNPLDIAPIVKETLKLLRASIPSTIEIRQEVGERIGRIMGDPTQVHQVVMNLCTNAAYAMREAGGLLEVGLERVAFPQRASVPHPRLEPGVYVRLTVRDSGVGMEPATVERIFEPYFTTKPKGEGTGLGLSVVHGIVRGYGGVVTVESEPEEGSTFRVYFPQIDGESEELQEVQPSIPGGSERVMFVDDERSLTILGKKMLGHLGYEVVALTSSVEALEYFRSHRDSVDLVITDLTMPHMTGDVLAREMMSIRPGIPIILCTGFSDSMSEDKARRMGLRDFITKPLIMKDLARTIRRALDSV
ncbi:MAG TPA: ATP-binding protein [Syntrophobacteraceae bacterium]|nr:ATP-binding protein [Syntrophobacteraceae bacterium]